MTTYAYKRCSTTEEKQNVDRQLFGMTFDEIFIEYASGKNEEGRPVFQTLLKTLEEGDEVFFQDMSRAGRNTKQLLHTVETLVEKGVKVVFVSENLTFISDTLDSMAGAVSKMMLTMLASVNELFLTQNRVNVKQGIKAAQAKGVKFGAANPKYRETYEKNKSSHKSTRQTQSTKEKMKPVVENIKQQLKYSSGSLNLKQIACNLNSEGYTTSTGKEFSEATVSRMIKRSGIDYKRKHKHI
ncbi:hypothetical protein KUA24_19 [Vibrio phage HNL01]|nr:hypothetical protein KUA24_19 [Vibrio phage HNL01]